MSSSRCCTESFTATHNFELADYHLLDGLGAGKYVRSSVFSVGGYRWAISYYPDGAEKKDVDNAGNASAFLYCVSQAKCVRTRFTLNMLEKRGNLELTKNGVIDRIIPAPTYDWGYPKFIEKSRLKSSSEFTSGGFIIPWFPVPVDAISFQNLQVHLHQMLKDGQGADVKFSVGGQLFSAHRCLLAARSPVFKAELDGPMKEKSTQCIMVDDIEPTIFEALLHFVYTDSLPDDEHYKEGRMAKLQHLLVAADRYGLDKLMVLCESKLCESIDVETAAMTLVLAEQHHCIDLKEACIEFMAQRNVLQAVLVTDGFQHLMESCPLIIKELLDMVSRIG
ncbi:unnamed protein product [Alopecurus aequalis]